MSSSRQIPNADDIELHEFPSSSATGFSKASLINENTLRSTYYNNNSSDQNSKLSQYENGDVTEAKVKRGLKARHMSMIALGGTIGTGLFVGIATPLQDAGPVNALVLYLFIGSIVYIIVQALGEMSTYIPIAGSFTVYNTRFLSKPLGAANGWLYWYNWAVTFAVEVSVIPSIINFWTDKVPIAAWVSIFLVLITLANLCSVKIYGETEFWVLGVKVVAIMGWLIFALCMVCGAGDQGAVGFRYWRNPGVVGDGVGLSKDLNTDRFLGWVSSLINAAFTFQGCETTSIAAGECANPEKTIPKAIKKVIFRILFFYIFSLFFIGLLVPFNDPQLNSDATYTASSPFIIAILNSGTPILPHIFNAVIFITVVSAGNSDVYLGSRVLYGLSESGIAPKVFQRCTKNGVPYVAVLATSVVGCLAYLSCSNGGTTAFNWLVNISTVAGLIAWAFIPLCHIRFVQALKLQGKTRDDLPFKGHFLGWGNYYVLFFIILITFIQGYDVFFHFNAAGFFTAYISLVIFFVLWIVFQIYYREKRFIIPLEEVDIDSDRRKIENTVWLDDEEDLKDKNVWEKFWLWVA